MQMTAPGESGREGSDIVLLTCRAEDALILLSSTLESLDAGGGKPSESDSLEEGVPWTKRPPSEARGEKLQKALMIQRALEGEVLMIPVAMGKEWALMESTSSTDPENNLISCSSSILRSCSICERMSRMVSEAEAWMCRGEPSMSRTSIVCGEQMAQPAREKS